jgi:hypothetical protein
MMLKPRCIRLSGWGNGLDQKKKKAQMNLPKIKMMFVMFLIGKTLSLHHELLPHGQVLNKQLYQEVLARLRDSVCRNRCELWENQTWMLHHDNAPAHASLLIRSYTAKHETAAVPQPPCSPDLAPAHCFLFPKLKATLKHAVSKP